MILILKGFVFEYEKKCDVIVKCSYIIKWKKLFWFRNYRGVSINYGFCF